MNVAAVPKSHQGTATAHDPQPTTVGQRSFLRSLLAFVGASFLWMQIGLVAIAVICSVAVGQRPIVITGGSMSPAVSRGDVIVIDDVDPATLKQNQLVTFDIGEGRVTHRIIDFADDGAVITKGDANAIADTMSVPRDRIIGRAQVIIPALGLPVVWLQDQEWSKLGLWLMLTTLALMAVFGGSTRSSRRQRRAELATASLTASATESMHDTESAVPAVIRSGSSAFGRERRCELANSRAAVTNKALTGQRVEPLAADDAATVATSDRTTATPAERRSSVGVNGFASTGAIAHRGTTPQSQARRRLAKPVAIAAARRRPTIMARVPRHGGSPTHRRTYIGRPTASQKLYSGNAPRLVPAPPARPTAPSTPSTSQFEIDHPTGQPTPSVPVQAATAPGAVNPVRPDRQIVSFAPPLASQLRFRIPLPRNRARPQAQQADQQPPARDRKE